MTDLRDQLPQFEAAARRLLAQPGRLVLVHARPATCHPDRGRPRTRPRPGPHPPGGHVTELKGARAGWRKATDGD